MNWVRKKLLSRCNTPRVASSHLVDEEAAQEDGEFSKEDIKRICKWFHLNNYKEMDRLTSYHFKNRWEGMLTDGLSTLWSEMLFRDCEENEEERYDQIWDKLYCLTVKQHKSNPFERASIILSIVEPDTDNVSTKKLIEYVDNVMNSFSLMMESCYNTEFKKWTINSTSPEPNSLIDLRDHIINSLMDKESASMEDLTMWMQSALVFRDMLGEVCSFSVSLNPPPRQLLPRPLSTMPWQSFVNLGHLIFLTSQLDQDDTIEWRLLYSKKNQGGNIEKFLKCTKNKGPTVLLIKDEDQNIFGAFSAHSWKENNQFYGDERCFLFTLSPMIRVFKPSRIDENYQYCCEEESGNCGVGFGGNIGHFGVWLSKELDHGSCSEKCDTFKDYIMPSRAPVFKLADLQVWATRVRCECKCTMESTASLECSASTGSMHHACTPKSYKGRSL